VPPLSVNVMSLYVQGQEYIQPAKPTPKSIRFAFGISGLTWISFVKIKPVKKTKSESSK